MYEDVITQEHKDALRLLVGAARELGPDRARQALTEVMERPDATGQTGVAFFDGAPGDCATKHFLAAVAQLIYREVEPTGDPSVLKWHIEAIQMTTAATDCDLAAMENPG